MNQLVILININHYWLIMMISPKTIGENQRFNESLIGLNFHPSFDDSRFSGFSSLGLVLRSSHFP